MSSAHPLPALDCLSDLLRQLGLPPPAHPLVAVVDYDKTPPTADLLEHRTFSLGLYKISLRPDFHGRVRYGQGHYDFTAGCMAFLKPPQVVSAPTEADAYTGRAVYVHPDLLRHRPLGRTIDRYGFFSYAISEALFLSDREKRVMGRLFDAVAAELHHPVDPFTDEIIIAQLELLLTHSNRFYHRQFLTRRSVNHDLIDALDRLLERYFAEERGLTDGLPSARFVSKELRLSQRYLSDMLQALTGLTTQQYLQRALVDRASDLLSTTALSVSEIAYRLGFQHSPSFSKFFKAKTRQSPLAFRASFG